MDSLAVKIYQHRRLKLVNSQSRHLGARFRALFRGLQVEVCTQTLSTCHHGAQVKWRLSDILTVCFENMVAPTVEEAREKAVAAAVTLVGGNEVMLRKAVFQALNSASYEALESRSKAADGVCFQLLAQKQMNGKDVEAHTGQQYVVSLSATFPDDVDATSVTRLAHSDVFGANSVTGATRNPQSPPIDSVKTRSMPETTRGKRKTVRKRSAAGNFNTGVGEEAGLLPSPAHVGHFPPHSVRALESEVALSRACDSDLKKAILQALGGALDVLDPLIGEESERRACELRLLLADAWEYSDLWSAEDVRLGNFLGTQLRVSEKELPPSKSCAVHRTALEDGKPEPGLLIEGVGVVSGAQARAGKLSWGSRKAHLAQGAHAPRRPTAGTLRATVKPFSPATVLEDVRRTLSPLRFTVSDHPLVAPRNGVPLPMGDVEPPGLGPLDYREGVANVRVRVGNSERALHITQCDNYGNHSEHVLPLAREAASNPLALLGSRLSLGSKSEQSGAQGDTRRGRELSMRRLTQRYLQADATQHTGMSLGVPALSLFFESVRMNRRWRGEWQRRVEWGIAPRPRIPGLWGVTSERLGDPACSKREVLRAGGSAFYCTLDEAVFRLNMCSILLAPPGSPKVFLQLEWSNGSDEASKGDSRSKDESLWIQEETATPSGASHRVALALRDADGSRMDPATAHAWRASYKEEEVVCAHVGGGTITATCAAWRLLERGGLALGQKCAERRSLGAPGWLKVLLHSLECVTYGCRWAPQSEGCIGVPPGAQLIAIEASIASDAVLLAAPAQEVDQPKKSTSSDRARPYPRSASPLAASLRSPNIAAEYVVAPSIGIVAPLLLSVGQTIEDAVAQAFHRRGRSQSSGNSTTTQPLRDETGANASFPSRAVPLDGVRGVLHTYEQEGSRCKFSSWCPDVLLMLQQMRERLQLPQTSFPTIEFRQRSEFDTAQRLQQLAKGPHADVFCYTSVLAHWGSSLRAEAVYDPVADGGNCGSDPKTSDGWLCTAVGPLRLLLVAITELYWQLFTRAATIPLTPVDNPNTRRALDFLMYSWFSGSPHVKLHAISTSAARRSKLASGSREPSCDQEADTMVRNSEAGEGDHIYRALLFYDILGQRVLFAETYAYTPNDAVLRVNTLAIGLNAVVGATPDGTLDCMLPERRRVLKEGGRSASARSEQWSGVHSFGQRKWETLQCKRGSVSHECDVSQLSLLLEEVERRANATAVLFFTPAEIGVGANLAGPDRGPSSYNCCGVVTLTINPSTSGTLRASFAVTPERGLLDAVVACCAEVLDRLVLHAAGESSRTIVQKSLWHRPLLVRDHFPPYDARFYNPFHFLGELLQGTSARYNCEYVLDRPSGLIRCTLWIPAVAGRRNSSTMSSSLWRSGRAMGEVGFPLAVGLGRTKKEAWEKAAWQALRGNFGHALKQLDVFKDVSNMLRCPQRRAAAGLLSGVSFQLQCKRERGTTRSDESRGADADEQEPTTTCTRSTAKAPPSDDTAAPLLFRCELRRRSWGNPKRLVWGVDEEKACRDGELLLVCEHADPVEAYILCAQRLLSLAKAPLLLSKTTEGGGSSPPLFDTWDRSCNFEKSFWHALCGALCVAFSGHVQVLLHSSSTLLSEVGTSTASHFPCLTVNLRVFNAADKSRSDVTLLQLSAGQILGIAEATRLNSSGTKADPLPTPAAGCGVGHLGVSEVTGLDIVEIATRVLTSAVAKHCSAQTQEELVLLMRVLHQWERYAQSSNRLTLMRKVESIAHRIFGLQCVVLVDMSHRLGIAEADSRRDREARGGSDMSTSDDEFITGANASESWIDHDDEKACEMNRDDGDGWGGAVARLRHVACPSVKLWSAKLIVHFPSNSRRREDRIPLVVMEADGSSSNASVHRLHEKLRRWLLQHLNSVISQFPAGRPSLVRPKGWSTPRGADVTLKNARELRRFIRHPWADTISLLVLAMLSAWGAFRSGHRKAAERVPSSRVQNWNRQVVLCAANASNGGFLSGARIAVAMPLPEDKTSLFTVLYSFPGAPKKRGSKVQRWCEGLLSVSFDRSTIVDTVSSRRVLLSMGTEILANPIFQKMEAAKRGSAWSQGTEVDLGVNGCVVLIEQVRRLHLIPYATVGGDDGAHAKGMEAPPNGSSHPPGDHGAPASEEVQAAAGGGMPRRFHNPGRVVQRARQLRLGSFCPPASIHVAELSHPGEDGADRMPDPRLDVDERGCGASHSPGAAHAACWSSTASRGGISCTVAKPQHSSHTPDEPNAAPATPEMREMRLRSNVSDASRKRRRSDSEVLDLLKRAYSHLFA